MQDYIHVLSQFKYLSTIEIDIYDGTKTAAELVHISNTVTAAKAVLKRNLFKGKKFIRKRYFHSPRGYGGPNSRTITRVEVIEVA